MRENCTKDTSQLTICRSISTLNYQLILLYLMVLHLKIVYRSDIMCISINVSCVKYKAWRCQCNTQGKTHLPGAHIDWKDITILRLPIQIYENVYVLNYETVRDGIDRNTPGCQNRKLNKCCVWWMLWETLRLQRKQSRETNHDFWVWCSGG